MDLGTYGKLFLMTVIHRKQPMTRHDLMAMLESYPELGSALGLRLDADKFVDWCIEEGALISTSSSLTLTKHGENVLNRLRTPTFDRLAANALIELLFDNSAHPRAVELEPAAESQR